MAPKPVEEKKTVLPPVQATPGDASTPPEGRFLGFTALTWSKIIPLGLMFFCILFNYTILRDTKVRGILQRGRMRRQLMVAESYYARGQPCSGRGRVGTTLSGDSECDLKPFVSR
jgi:hypothetical protein